MAANDVPCCEPMFWVYMLISSFIVCFAGLVSGLTIGLMSLTLVDLEVLIKAGQPQDRRNAAKILPIVKNQHLLLCTLLISNSMAMEALPIFLDALLPAWGAILISVTLILAFGEIIPQAICSRYGLSVGAKLSPFVRLLVIIFFPLSYPISKLLDLLLGKRHSALLRRAELKMFVDMHANEAGNGGELTHEETTIITGALDLSQKTAKDAMTPISKVFSIGLDSNIDEDTMELILRKGHSRVPIYSGTPSNIIGLILVKNLIKCRLDNETPIRDLTIRTIPRVHDCLPLYDILHQFQKGHSHMAVVIKCNDTESLSTISETKNDKKTKPRNMKIPDLESGSKSDEEVIGIITLEDVMEELLQEEILDETDDYVEVHNKIKINMLPASMRSPTRSRSPETNALSSRLQRWRTPGSSPLSSNHQTPCTSCNNTPVLRSPLSPYISSPFILPALAAVSPTQPMQNHTSGAARYSPSHHVSRKSYEKLNRPDGF
ncbi:hypothetical protein ACFE04_028970 [Oxalis oulophora]